MSSRRPVFPRQVFTPTQSTPPPSHYIVLFDETNSYQIAARSSLKQINGDVVFVTIRNKLVKAKIVFRGSLEECNSEYVRLACVLQDESNAPDDYRATNYPSTFDDPLTQQTIRKTSEPTSTLIPMTPSPRPFARVAFRTSVSDNEEEEEEEHEHEAFVDDEITFLNHRKRLNKKSHESTKKKKRSTHNHPIEQTDENDHAEMFEEDVIHRTKTSKNLSSSNELSTINNRVNELNQQLIANSCKFDQQMQKLYSKIDRLTSTASINRHALEPYVDKTGEKFRDEIMFNDVNLLDIMATDYADYSRKILRIIFAPDELKQRILPPGRDHIKRQPLDSERFSLFIDAVRSKYRLDSNNFGIFYKSLLRRKLTDFLIEERRRDAIKNARKSMKQNVVQCFSPEDEQLVD